ncbi:MAG: YitT family protein [Erysipelotrichaceae bacterium]|nr:YitT family protein [Erysipelotrichaceae bacterium]
MKSEVIVKKNKLLNLALIVIGNFILAFSVAVFILPYNILSGGVAGMAVVLNSLLGIDKGFAVNFLVIILFLIGWLVLGKEFAIKTFLSSVTYPIFLSLITQVLPIFEIDSLLASLYGGLLAGVGIGLVMRTGASTGGMDIPPLIINKITNIKVSTLIMIIDTVTVLLGFMTYGLEKVLIGFISVFATGFMIDKVLVFGGSISKSVQIISKNPYEIIDKIHNTLDRGTTISEAIGGYTKEKRVIILVVVSQKQYNELIDIVNSIDKEAFIITTDATSVHGEGFSFGFRV